MRAARLFAMLVALIATSLATASDPTGTWNGVLKLTLPKGEVPKEHKAEIDKARVAFKKAKMTLELRADKTYRSKSLNTPADGKTHDAEGTWTVKGNVVTLKPLKRDGKPASGKGAELQVLNVSSDGRKLSRTITPMVLAEYTKG